MKSRSSLHSLFLVSVMTAALGIGASFAAGSQPQPDQHEFTVEQARAELDELYTRLRASHFDLFAHRPVADYERYYQQLKAQLTEPLSRLQLQIMLQRFAAYGRVAHSRIDFPALEFERFRSDGGGVLPLQVKVRDGRFYLASDLSGQPEAQLRRGSEIVAINGESSEIWRKRLLGHVSADNDYLADTLLELRFVALLWLELGAVESVELVVTEAAGDTRALTLRTRSREQMQQASDQQPQSLALNWSKREARMLGDDIAYLRPGPFYNPDPDAASVWDNASFASFVDQSFANFAQAEAKMLLVDLRDNPGGDNSFSDLLLRRFADQPFRFCSQFKIRVSEATTASNAARLSEGYSAVSAQFAKLYAGRKPGEVVEFEIPLVEPAPANERFAGKVYVLINRYSYSNAVTTAAMSQDYGFATILGEESADLASTYGAMEQFTLSRSGIVVGYPKAHIIRPNGNPSPRGVVPDIVIETPLLEGADDPVLQQALAIIRPQ